MKKGDTIKYGGVPVIITEINHCRISLKPLDPFKNPNDYYGNIPLNECRPGNKLTNVQMIEPYTLSDASENLFNEICKALRIHQIIEWLNKKLKRFQFFNSTGGR